MPFEIIKLTSRPDGSFEELDTDRRWMPVPRCDTCGWWHRFELEDIGQCEVVATIPARHYPRALGHLETRSDFGCVQWKGGR
jgi:hypothetical protein